LVGAACLTKIAESNAAKAIIVRSGVGVKTVESHRSAHAKARYP
jgi:hypothetical protein